MGKFIVGNVKWKQNEKGIQQFILFEADGITRRNGTGKSYKFKFWNQKTGVVIGGGSLVATDAVNGEYDYTVLDADTLLVDDFIGELIEDPNGIGIRSDTFEVDVIQSSGIVSSSLLQQLQSFGLKAIYIADDLVEGRLTQWNDQSGNNYHLTPISVGAEGDVRIDPNAKKVVTFSDSGFGGQDRMINSSLVVDSQNFSAMAVYSSFGKQTPLTLASFDVDYFKGAINHFDDLMWTNDGANIGPTSLLCSHAIAFAGIRAGLTSCELYTGESQEDVGPLSAATYVGIGTGGWGAITVSDPNVYAIVVFNSVLSDSDFKSARAILMSSYNVLPQTKVIVLEGDSLTEGTGSSNNEGYPFHLKVPNYRMNNVSTGGHQWSDVTSEFAAMTAKYYDATKSKNMLIVFIGTNDLSFSGKTPAQLFAESEAYIIAAKAAGWFVVQITVFSNNSYLDINKNAYNDLLVGGSADLVIDVRDLNTIGYDQANLDQFYFSVDQTHLTSAGHKALGEFVQSKIESLL